MLITENITIKISRGNLGFYNKLLDNKFNVGDEIDIPVSIAPKNLNIRVRVSCDLCGLENTVVYRTYNQCLDYGYYSCNKCKHIKRKLTNLKKYGIENYNNINKRRKTHNEKYGYYFNNRDKAKNTCLEKYGEDNVSKVNEVKHARKETNIKNWGVDNVFKSEIIKENIKATHLKNLGVDHPSKSEEIKNKKVDTCRKNIGVDFPTQSIEIITKIKENNIEKYGTDWYTKTEEYKNKTIETNNFKYNVDWYMSSNEFKEKSKIVIKEKYGCDYPIQNIEVFQKQQLSGFKCNKYNNIFYRGSYELDFLIFCEKESIDVINGISISYEHNSKNRIYHSDFYLPDYNILCEIKSSYYYNKYIESNLAKEKASIELGYKFLFVIDKNYEELKKLIS